MKPRNSVWMSTLLTNLWLQLNRPKANLLKEDFDMPNLEKFLTAFSQNLLEAYLKSEPVPAEQGAVKVAVAKNFDELVVQNTKDVLVEFYAPWCGHCKKLAPVFDELGAKMDGTNVDIVKMDATANDVPPGYDVRGFPTLFWVPSDTKKPVAYDEDVEIVKMDATANDVPPGYDV